MRPTLRILLIWALTASVLIGQAVLPNRRLVFQPAGSTTLNEGLIAYWKMDEVGGASVNRVDSQGANDLDAQGTTITNVVGKIGNAVDLELSSNDFLTIADNADLSFGDEDFSMGGWVRLESIAGAARIIDKYNATGDNREYLLWYDAPATRFKFAVSSDGTAGGVTIVTADTFGAASTATWYFVAAGHDSVANVIWISVNAGTKDTAAHSTGCSDKTSTFLMGVAAAGGNQWDGSFDEMFVYGKTLTDSELDELYGPAGAGKTCCPFD